MNNDDSAPGTSSTSYLPSANRNTRLNFYPHKSNKNYYNFASYENTNDNSATATNAFTIHSMEARHAMVTCGGGGCATNRRWSSAFGERQDAFARDMNEKLSYEWIESEFQKRECIKFIPQENSDRCGCGRLSVAHSQLALSRFTTTVTRPSLAVGAKKWNIREHTAAAPTDAYGRIEFQGGIHAHKAHYLRLAFDSEPTKVMQMIERVWNLQRPRLVITIHGGMTNFCVAEKLGRLFREGMLKAAETTGAWIFTSGVDSGVVRHVARALDEAVISTRMRTKVVTIGIAPWGLLRRRERLIGRDAQVVYDRHAARGMQSRYAALNDRHSYFLLVDNGTVGRYGADIVFRKRFEEFLAEQQSQRCGDANRIPIVCLALEGGLYTLNCIHEYLTKKPNPIPVLICEGSGRVSDALAFADRHLDNNGNLSNDIIEQLLEIIQATLNYENVSYEEIYEKIVDCVRHRRLLTVFRLGEDSSNDVDRVILRALLTGQSLSMQEQLSLTLAWDRVDVARSVVLRDRADWCAHALYVCMMDALLLDRVEFVRLILENGLSLKKFLTFGRLERLYNADSERLNTLYHLIGGRHIRHSAASNTESAFTLLEIGAAIEKLMGNAYRCHYTTRSFKRRYDCYRGKSGMKRVTSFVGASLHLAAGSYNSARRKRSRAKEARLLNAVFDSGGDDEFDFRHPFNDLLLWAVLTRRHALAKCVWHYGGEAMAKALVAIRLYKCMSRAAADDYTEVEVTNQLREYAEDFLQRSLELLNHSYQQDDLMTMRLLTAELPNWGHHTCLSLAVIANNKRFLAHPCCQILLAELWHGGLRFRSQSNIKVILAILFPPSILLLDFKTFAQEKFTARAKRHDALVAGARDFSAGAYDSDITANEFDSETQCDDNTDDSDEARENHRNTKSQLIIPKWTNISRHKESLSTFLRSFSKNENDKQIAQDHKTTQFLPRYLSAGNTIDKKVKQSLCETLKNKYRNRNDDGYDENVDKNNRENEAKIANDLEDENNLKDYEDSYYGYYLFGDTIQSDTSQKSPPVTFTVSQPTVAKFLNMTRSTSLDASAIDKNYHNSCCAAVSSTTTRHIESSEKILSPTTVQMNTVHEANQFYMHATKTWRSYILNCVSKFVLFYRAPITTFWIWTISFCIFMLLFIYVLLIEFPITVSWLEYFLFVYVLALGIEHFRKLLILESSSFMEKMCVFYNRYWNILTSIAVITYFVGFGFRFSKPAIHVYSRTILASNSVLWHMKLFDYLGVHPRIGPYITMAGKMIISMSYIIVMLLITLMAFGVVRQSITFPHEKWSWILVRNIFYKPYFMLYGEVYAGEIDTCSDEGTNCVPGSWIPPLVMVIFLLVANILLINMLIAIFNNIFNVTNAMSQQVWMFQRYEQVLEYKATPVVPPPFTPIVHIVMLLQYFCRNGYCRRRRRSASNSSFVDFAIKIYLNENELKKLHDFEEDCMDYLSRRDAINSNTQTQHEQQYSHEFAEGIDELSLQINELAAENAILKVQIGEILACFQRLEKSQNDLYEKANNAPASKADHPKILLPPSAALIKGQRILPRARVIPFAPRGITCNDASALMPSTISQSKLQNAFATAVGSAAGPLGLSEESGILEPEINNSEKVAEHSKRNLSTINNCNKENSIDSNLNSTSAKSVNMEEPLTSTLPSSSSHLISTPSFYKPIKIRHSISLNEDLTHMFNTINRKTSQPFERIFENNLPINQNESNIKKSLRTNNGNPVNNSLPYSNSAVFSSFSSSISSEETLRQDSAGTSSES